MSDITTWMVKDIVSVGPETSVLEACSVMKKNSIGAAIVVKDQRPIGIFTERDVLSKIIADSLDPKTTSVKDVMSSNIKTASVHAGYKEVYDLMHVNMIRHLPIVDGEKLVGIVSIRDLLRYNTRTLEQTIAEQNREIAFTKNLLDSTNDERSKKLYVENERLQGLIRVDDLTGLYNHKYFEEILVKEISRARRYNRPVSLLFLDIDYFKHYNDVNGHEQGNVVLKQLAEVLKSTSRQSDTPCKMSSIDIVARYGGEEFVIVLPETPKKGGYARSERILSDVRNYPFFNRESQPSGKLTISIGVSEYPTDALEWTDLINKADEALYRAKNSGRDRIV